MSFRPMVGPDGVCSVSIHPFKLCSFQCGNDVDNKRWQITYFFLDTIYVYFFTCILNVSLLCRRTQRELAEWEKAEELKCQASQTQVTPSQPTPSSNLLPPQLLQASPVLIQTLSTPTIEPKVEISPLPISSPHLKGPGAGHGKICSCHLWMKSPLMVQNLRC